MSGQPPKRAIDPVFDQPGVGFVFLPAGKKFPPIEEGWQNKSHSFGEAQRHVSTGGNVGVMAGNGYIGLDQDDREALRGAGSCRIQPHGRHDPGGWACGSDVPM